jgi:hypothetical protein
MPKAPYIPSTISSEALKVINGLARVGVKCAEIGGGLDTPFEQAFSNVAHAYLKDKAPALLDYEVGFQLIDRNQENTKAIGVFGFKAGSQWLYGPVFFLNGDLKGHELLYIKNQDMFVPMQEDWLNYILNRRPNVLGKSVDRNLSNIGVMAPNLSQLSRSPSKFAAAYDTRPAWAKDSLAACAYWATVHPKNDPKYRGILDLPAFLKEAGYQTLVALFKTFEQYPRVKAAYDQFHGMEVVEQAIKEAKQRAAEARSNSVLKEAATCRMTPDGVRCSDQRSVLEDEVEKTLRPKKKKKPNSNPALAQAIKEAKGSPVAVHTYDEVLHTGTALGGMSKADREKLLRDRVLVRDKRPDPEVSKVYEVQTRVSLFNPDKSGLFDVLIKPGEFTKCLVLMWPFSDKRRQTWCTVVRLDGNKGKGKSWLNTHPSQVWCGKHYPNDAFAAWAKEQDEADGDKIKKGGLFVVFNEQGSGSVPFEADREIMAGLKTYHVAFNDYALKGRAGWLPEVQDERPSHDLFMDDRSESSPRITFTGKDGTKLRCTGADLMVPNGFKLLTLKGPPEDMEDDEEGKKDKPPFSSDPADTETGAAEEKDQELLAPHVSDPAPLYLGDMRDIDYLVGTKTAALKVAAAGSEVIVNGHRMTKLAGLIHLIRDHGLREKQARMVLARAEAERIFKGRIKYADQYYDMQKTGPNAPSIPDPAAGFDPITGGLVPTMQPSEQYVQVPEMSGTKTDRSVYAPMGPEPKFQGPSEPDRDTQRAALDAAQTGQKEIFDTTMIGGLLKAVRDDNLVDRYRGDLLKGLDRLGRILFLFYWHNEKFAERYGQQDMVELEDGLRNAFESVGGVVLFLMQRSVDPHNDNLDGVDLSDVAST